METGMAGRRSDPECMSSSSSEGPALSAPPRQSGAADTARDPGNGEDALHRGARSAPAPSQDSESEDSDAGRRRRRRRKEEKQRSKDKALKVKKSGSKDKKKAKDKKHKDRERRSSKDKGPVQLSKFLERGESSGGAKYSAVSGKKIKLKVEKTKTDREAELKRKHLLAVLNASYD